ncbi:hypothetical protein HWV62_17040 [Athelia sp. TMB]|nr:hypothetical protein HWV62_17040 [Athelia sp. TMB]
MVTGLQPQLYCYPWGPFTLAYAVASLVYDTLVLVGVALAMYRNAPLDTSRMSYSQRIKLLITGKGLYKVSKMLLKSGQLYYAYVLPLLPVFVAHTRGCSVTIGVQLLCAILSFRGMRYTQVCYLALVPLSASMACKVFRMVLLCDTVEDPLDTAEVREALGALASDSGQHLSESQFDLNAYNLEPLWHRLRPSPAPRAPMTLHNPIAAE